MSDREHPQDQSEPSKPSEVSLPRDEKFDEQVQRVTEELKAPKQDKPVAPSDLGDPGEVTLERERGTVRRERVELEGLEEGNKDISFKRKMLIVVLAILALVALGSLAVIAAGVAAGAYPVVASAVVSLSGAGGGSVFAWNVYVKATTPAKPEPEPTGEGP